MHHLSKRKPLMNAGICLLAKVLISVCDSKLLLHFENKWYILYLLFWKFWGTKHVCVTITR